MPPRPDDLGWTRQRVETTLIDAFRHLPGLPVYSTGGALVVPNHPDLTHVLRWATLLDADPHGRKYLWAWARCRATRDSFSELCRLMGWGRSTAEEGRRRAARVIAAAL